MGRDTARGAHYFLKYRGLYVNTVGVTQDEIHDIRERFEEATITRLMADGTYHRSQIKNYTESSERLWDE
jgi:hypothetical protein